MTGPANSWGRSIRFTIGHRPHCDRAFDRMPELSDALLAAGCEDADTLGHCPSEGPHVRGCWIVDLVLGRG